jgi:hypothetical protein
MTTRRRRPWRMLAPLATVLMLAALWTIYWTVASVAIKNAYADAERRLAANGVTLVCDDAQWSGFPFRVERWCRAPKVSLHEAGGRVDVSAADLLLAVQAYNPRHAIALLDGPTVVGGAMAGEIRHERALASLKFSSDESWQASIELPKLVVEPMGSAGRLLLSARMVEKGNADLALSAEKLDLKLADGKDLPIDALDATATLPGEALSEDVLRYLSRTGKVIAITGVSAKQGELAITGSGEIAIDREGYLTGRIPTHINHVDLLFDIVKRLVHLSDEDAQAAKTIIGLLQQGNAGDTELDLIAKDHKLYWGPFKLTKLTPLF